MALSRAVKKYEELVQDSLWYAPLIDAAKVRRRSLVHVLVFRKS